MSASVRTLRTFDLAQGAGKDTLLIVRGKADGCVLSQRAVKDVAQVEEPGERGGAPGARGGVALAPSFILRSMPPDGTRGRSRRTPSMARCNRAHPSALIVSSARQIRRRSRYRRLDLRQSRLQGGFLSVVERSL